MRWLDGITDSMDMRSEQASGVGDGAGKPGLLQSMGSQRQIRLSNRTELKRDNLLISQVILLLFLSSAFTPRLHKLPSCTLP